MGIFNSKEQLAPEVKSKQKSIPPKMPTIWGNEILDVTWSFKAIQDDEPNHYLILIKLRADLSLFKNIPSISYGDWYAIATCIQGVDGFYDVDDLGVDMVRFNSLSKAAKATCNSYVHRIWVNELFDLNPNLSKITLSHLKFSGAYSSSGPSPAERYNSRVQETATEYDTWYFHNPEGKPFTWRETSSFSSTTTYWSPSHTVKTMRDGYEGWQDRNTGSTKESINQIVV